MKHFLPALTLAAICGFAGAVNAQLPDDPQSTATIKVTTRVNADGTRTDTQKDLEARTCETKTYNKNNKLTHRAVFALDEQGRPTDGVNYDATGKVLGGVSFKYDANGRISEQIEKDAAGMIKRRVVLRYDTASGRLAGAEAYDARGKRIQQETETPVVPKVRKKK